jgi:maltooligosyltrehalose trehalohydrolase
MEGAPEGYPLDSEGNGYYSGWVAKIREGDEYKFRIESGTFPDPASRFQPRGPHGPSQIIDPNAFRWTDALWPGVAREGQVIYEMHVGTFTREGTLEAARKELPELAALGVTVIELMPLAEFPGRFGWGYDGVDLYAPSHLYGRPDDLRAFVNRAHELGLGVILDVVFNHFGPDGWYLARFSNDYTTDRYPNEWGKAINFDGPGSAPVREYFISNCAYWILEFHFDGFRFDAVQQLFDSSEDHILATITRAARKAAHGRSIFLCAENERQQGVLLRSPDEGGYGLDVAWNDDFHHTARVALARHREAYYTDFKGTPQEFISSLKWGYLYQGQWFAWQGKRRGTPSLDLNPSRFVTYLQNHDQVANSLRGERIHQMANPGIYRAITALFLLGPGTPLLFQGQEFAASAPFLYFADHNPELAPLVAEGRREFLCQFPSIASPEARAIPARPDSEETFLACKLDFSERERHAGIHRLHRDLLELRKTDPVFRAQKDGFIDGAVLGPDCFLLRFFGGEPGDRLLVLNLGAEFSLEVAPEPLIAPPEGLVWRMKWSSEAPVYGGPGIPSPRWNGPWRVPGTAAIVFEPVTENSVEA